MPQNYKTILIAYDHSNAAQIAAKKAVEIGRKFNSVFQTVFVMTSRNDKDAPDAQAYIEALEKVQNVSLNFKIHSGSPTQVIVQEQKDNRPDLVVMGSHGMEGFMPQFLGSTAYKVANSCDCPVLIIPEAAKDFNFKNILVPVDSSSETRQKFSYASALANVFGSVVHILGVSKHKDSETQKYVNVYVSQAEDFMKNRGVQYGSSMQLGQSVSSTLIEYAGKMNCGIIFTMTENESAGFMLGPSAMRLVNSSPYPVFCIHNHHVEGVGGGGL